MNYVRIPFTKEGYEKVLAEHKKLLSERPEAVENLRKAREMGDLSENGYYKAARARLSGLDSRLRHYTKLVKLGYVTTVSQTEYVEIGSHVTVVVEKTEHTYTIVGGYESDPANKTVSYISPVGKALLKRRVGDIVDVSTPSGIRQYTIKKIV